MGDSLNVSWLNQNALRNYPLSEVATRKSSVGDFTLPTDFLVDLVISVNPEHDYDPTKFFLSQVTIYNSLISLVFSYDTQIVGAASIPVSSHVNGATYRAYGSTNFEDTLIQLAVWDINELLTAGGQHDFDLDGGRIESSAVRPCLRGVSSVTIVNGTDESVPLRGDIRLVAGENITLTPIAGSGISSIKVSASLSSTTSDDCEEGSSDLNPPVRSISGVGPNSSGDIQLVGDSCLEVLALTAGLALKDMCSQSCCGDDELEVIVNDVDLLRVQINTLENTVARVDALLTGMHAALGFALANLADGE